MPNKAASKPRVHNLVLLDVLYVISAGLIAYSYFSAQGDYRDFGVDVPFRITFVAYGAVIVAILSVIALLLIIRHRRLGLMLTALVAAGIVLAYGQELLALGSFLNLVRIMLDLVAIVLGVLGLIYGSLYLFREPNKSFFH